MIYLCVLLFTVAAAILEPPMGQIEHIEEGNNITFRCVGEGYPSPLVEWRRVNGVLSGRASTNNMSLLTGIGNETRVTVDLIFTGLYRDDTAAYECSVSNLLNAVTRSVNLIVRCTYTLNCIIYQKLVCTH